MRVVALIGLGTVIALTLLNACAPSFNSLDRVIHKGELVVLTRQGPTTFYESNHGQAGLEYELVEKFAEHLGVKVKYVIPDNLGELFDKLQNGEADFAAAGLTITAERQKSIRFTPAYQTITQQLIYNTAYTNRPQNLNEVSGIFEVLAHSSHSERLQQLKAQGNSVNWSENTDTDTTELLSHVADGMLDYTVVDSNEFAYDRRYYPELQVAFDMSDPQQLAWAFAKQGDSSLYNEAVAFFKELNSNGQIDKLLAHNYQHVDSYDYRGSHSFLSQARLRLPMYREYFEVTAKQYNIDWRLLAAVAYQESHWRPEAVSPTGVRGMMMLTQATADYLGVETRTDVESSIAGGARYLRSLIDKIPDRIPEPDRTWLALAAYNIGYGHLEDARILTKIHGGNPDKWLDVKSNLPLLSKRKWYKSTRFGYARGYEPVRYVDNIRSYYDILTWYLEREDPEQFKSPVSEFNFHLL